MRAARDSTPYLRDILESIERIKTYTRGVNQEQFLSDHMLQDAIVRRIEVIGEASGQVSSELKVTYSEVPWRDIKDMRNRLIHDYGNVDEELVWGVIKSDLHALEKQIRRILDELASTENGDGPTP